MDPTRYRTALIRNAAIGFAMFLAWRAYEIAHISPDARRTEILPTVVPLAVGIGIFIYYFRLAGTPGEKKRLSHLTLFVITLIIILIAVVFRHV